MMTDPLDGGLPELTEGLAHCARQIDTTFTRVGDRLGEGLTLFETLNGSLEALAGELSGGGLGTTRDALQRMAGELRAFGDGLPAESEMLQTLATRNGEAAQCLGRLHEHLQLIAILARSTRIEAASVQANRGDLVDFTNRIVALTGDAKRTVETCVRDHDRLTGLLGTALSQQRDFVARYRDSLSSAAGKLERSGVALEDRALESVELTKNVAAHSAKASVAVGAAIFAMQSGDSIRQRLEHSVAALRLAILADSEDGCAEEGWSSDEGSAIDLVLRRLQAAQLREAARALKDEVHQIDAALAALAGDTASTVRLGRSLYGGEGASSRSSFEALEAELAQASVLIQKCDAARGLVDRATEALTNLLDQFQQTVAELSITIEDIVIIGTNAGLLAVRLGNDGRGLVVIAGEVKSVAGRIAQDASRLKPIFSSMQKASSELRDRERGGANDMTALDATMRRSLGQMRESGKRLGETLDRLARDGAQFGAIVGESRVMFSDPAVSGETIEGAADRLDEAADEPSLSPTEAAAVEAALQLRVWPTYTMAAERTVHQQVRADFGLAGDVDAGVARAVA